MTEFDNFSKLWDWFQQEPVRHNVRSWNQFDKTFCNSKDWIRKQSVSIWIELDIFQIEHSNGIHKDIMWHMHIFHTTLLINILKNENFKQFYLILPHLKNCTIYVYRLLYLASHDCIVQLIGENYEKFKLNPITKFWIYCVELNAELCMISKSFLFKSKSVEINPDDIKKLTCRTHYHYHFTISRRTDVYIIGHKLLK